MRAGACEPEYQNIALPLRDRDQPKRGHPGPAKRALAQPRSAPDSAQVPAWLPRSLLSLCVLLTLSFLLCIALSALVLVKSAEMSRDIAGLKREFSNFSDSAFECREEQRKGGAILRRDIGEVVKSIATVRGLIEAMKHNLKSAPAEITQISKNTQKILEALEKTNTKPPQ